jgi:hypothetical protein
MSNSSEPTLELDMVIFSLTEVFALVFLCNLAGFAIALSMIGLFQ